MRSDDFWQFHGNFDFINVRYRPAFESSEFNKTKIEKI